MIFEQGPDPVVVIDDDGRVVMANRAAREMHGVDVEKLFVWTSGRDAELTSLRAQLRVGGRGTVELKVRDDRDAERIFALDGRAHGPLYVVVMRDVTEQRALERELQHLRKQKDAGELTATIVHEFNNTLTAILLGASILEDAVDGSASARQLARDIRDGAQRAASVVRRLLAFLRRPASKPERTHLGAAIDELRALLEGVLGPAIRLSVSVGDDLADVVVERDELDRLLVALATSARQAMLDGGELIVAAANQEAAPRAHDYVALTVMGPGLLPDVRERARRFAKANGGCVAVRGAPAHGTSVAIYLPCVAAERTPAASEGDLEGGSETILVVDPDGPVRGAVGAVLRDLGYVVVDAASGEAALKEARRVGPAVRLVLADVKTPGLRENGLLAQLSHAGGSPHFLWMSGEPDGVHGPLVEPLLRKAFSPAQLARRVREMLDEPSEVSASLAHRRSSDAG